MQSKAKSEVSKEEPKNQQVSEEASCEKEASPTKMQSSSPEAVQATELTADQVEKEVSSKLKDLNLQEQNDVAKS